MIFAFFCDRGRIQTCNLLSRNQMRYSVAPRGLLLYCGANIGKILFVPNVYVKKYKILFGLNHRLSRNLLTITTIDKMNYFQFFFQSSNQHGVHSPFVYNYLTQALYRPHRSTSARKKHFVTQTIQYFSPNHITDFTRGDFLPNNQATDMAILDAKHCNHSTIDHLVHHFHNDSVGVITHLHQHKKAIDCLQNHDKITVVLHFYWFAVFFIREEQQKEIFILRL